jgi:hypothetical protein
MSKLAQAIRSLEDQREKIDSALSILRNLEDSAPRLAVASAASFATRSSARKPPSRATGRRNISEEGRRRIAEAQRLRWARVRAEQGRQRRGRAA